MSLILYTPMWWFQMPHNCIVLCVVELGTDKSQLIRILMLLNWSLTYLLRVLLDKLNGSQLVKKSRALYGTRSSITALPLHHPETDKSPVLPLYFFKTPYYTPFCISVFQVVSSRQVYHRNPTCTALLPHNFHMLSAPLVWVWIA